jgi:hypothetical protein
MNRCTCFLLRVSSFSTSFWGTDVLTVDYLSHFSQLLYQLLADASFRLALGNVADGAP